MDSHAPKLMAARTAQHGTAQHGGRSIEIEEWYDA